MEQVVVNVGSAIPLISSDVHRTSDAKGGRLDFDGQFPKITSVDYGQDVVAVTVVVNGSPNRTPSRSSGFELECQSFASAADFRGSVVLPSAGCRRQTIPERNDLGVSAVDQSCFSKALCRFVWNATITVWPSGAHLSPRPSRQREGGESPSAGRVASQKSPG